MALTAAKIAPSLAVAAFTGYCIWPTVSRMASPPPPPPKVEKIADLAPGLFSPAMPPRPTKNPFGGLDADALAEAKASGRFDAQMRKGHSTTKKSAVVIFNPATEFRLEATSILGHDKLAVINGKFYAPGQTVSSGAGSACIIADILPNKVLLEYQGKVVTLMYSNTPAAPTTKKKSSNGESGN